MKTFIKKHVVALCGLFALLATLLPFASLDDLYYTVNISLIGFLSDYKGFYSIALFLIPIILIVFDFVHVKKVKKILCIVLSSINLLAAFGIFGIMYLFFEEEYIICSPSVGFFVILVADILLIVFSVLFAGKNFDKDSTVDKIKKSKIGKKGKDLSEKAVAGAASIGSEVVTATKEQAELTGLKSEINVIDKEINASYLMTGKKFVEYVINSNEMPGIDVSDVLKLMEPKLERKDELNQKIIKLEKRIRDEKIIREKQAAEKEYETEKEKLEKALKMDIIEQSDYDERVIVLKKKLDNFEAIRKLEQQVDLGIITEEEKNQKLFELLN